MRRILAEVIKCVRLLTEIRASLARIEGQMDVLVEGPDAPHVDIRFGPVSEQTLTKG